jgi:hypothetical protein
VNPCYVFDMIFCQIDIGTCCAILWYVCLCFVSFFTVCEYNLLISCVASYVDIVCENKVPDMSKIYHDSWLECVLIILILLIVIKTFESCHDIGIIGHTLVLVSW